MGHSGLMGNINYLYNHKTIIYLPARMQSLCFCQCVRRLWTSAQARLLPKLGNIQKYVNRRLQHNKVMCILYFIRTHY